MLSSSIAEDPNVNYLYCTVSILLLINDVGLKICLSCSCSLFTLCKSCFGCAADYQANLRAVLGHVRGPAQGPPQEQLHAQGRGCALSGAKLAEVLGGLVEILNKKGILVILLAFQQEEEHLFLPQYRYYLSQKLL
jgi:hypothetical protein